MTDEEIIKWRSVYQMLKAAGIMEIEHRHMSVRWPRELISSMGNSAEYREFQKSESNAAVQSGSLYRYAQAWCARAYCEGQDS